ncbi:TPA: transcriptional regulator [Streptococcus pyogenes]|uniref:transcriptional regulator n=1 Tax=Streptococcus pyogenes TaxID=1314 RepID=UPI0004592215|nr:transcriptional regulator [Streptococcus pyogenes]HER4523712.1 transcriptional regulator [Streptococcus pyogenes NGAS747]HER4527122.1 transcriptional regulator [Streptococcus pyogenes NGAS739]HER4537786.1 transcriptional regulator [Streptococcus pyogenes NGAS673]HER4539166.1 transcriptional regulator [Streptococcus pyogenes NGAS668]HER4542506.1 transcriptional regulator [Streptococcus pyogenes NGAS669]HER4549921.1 transcriptional regulator [Streptococcus pyogenes NGAS660]HER4550907.1 tran
MTQNVCQQNITYTVKERFASYILKAQANQEVHLNFTLLANRFGISDRHLKHVLKQLIFQRIIERICFKTCRIADLDALTQLSVNN